MNLQTAGIAAVLVPGECVIITDQQQRWRSKRCGKNALIADKNPVKGEWRKYIINTGQAYGEWAEPTEVHQMTWKDFVIPPMETATAYASYVMQLMSEIAEELGEKKDADFYKEKASKIKRAYQELVKCEGFTLDTNQQARLVRPLYDVLRSEFDFKGIVMTDWVIRVLANKKSIYRNALASEAAKAGGDIFMSGEEGDYKDILQELKDGKLPRKQLEMNGTRLLHMIEKLV